LVAVVAADDLGRQPELRLHRLDQLKALIVDAPEELRAELRARGSTSPGDRQLNRALHTIALVRLRDDPMTRSYAARRRTDGKSPREIRRCVKRAIARQLFKLLQRCDHAGVEIVSTS
jgi:arginine repressor